MTQERPSKLVPILLIANVLLTAYVLSILMDAPGPKPPGPTISESTTTGIEAGLNNMRTQVDELRMMLEAIKTDKVVLRSNLAQRTIDPLQDPLEAALNEKALLLVNQINALKNITESNVVQAGQLWREAQLTLEGAVLGGDSSEFEQLRSTTATLQSSIEKTIPGLLAARYTQARQQESLRDGLTHWAGASAYLALYPNDGTPSAAETAQKIGYEHERVRQEILQKAQTKYNLWACEQIKKAWVDIKDANSPISKSDNKKFYNSCVHFLATIDSSLLDMSTGELYREVLHFVKERMPLEYFQDLIKEIQNANKKSFDVSN
jgi:hypothetical protein